ncbi:hypothetical protein KFK09_013743 [Dendrobium nobile]|uniref:Uncharacterized protein n=1 Tax=Dendrobium nobile TaxID=94219 RepID=A0A8T3B8A3_DENNO|nr:hypothetical protein KFK09_013743 [Dendrobium nobile]
MPEHPPCLTPILKRRSSFLSTLILLRWLNALSDNEMAGAMLPDVGVASLLYPSCF